MTWSLKIAKIGGIEIKLHFTFLLFLAWIGFSYYLQGGVDAAITGVVFISLIFLCVLLHEFGHALAARLFGIPTPDITLLPIGGVARLQRIPDQPWQELIVALAGPIVNVIIAAALIFFLGQNFDLEGIHQLDNPEAAFLAKLASVNIWLVLFNLIPAFPMDGGRVLRALLATVMSYSSATNIAATIGQGLAVVFGLVGLFGNPLLLLIAFFIFLAARSEASLAEIKDLSRGISVSDAMITHLVKLPENATLDDAVQALLRTSQHEFPVVAPDGHFVGLLTRDDLISALRENGPNASVRDALRTDLPEVTIYDPLQEAFLSMQECACPALPVVDREGRFVGLITPENIGELMLVQSIGPRGGRPAWRPY